MELRYYQKQAITNIKNEWNEGNDKTLIVLATGTGKTIVFSSLTNDCVKDGKRVLVLAHREELLDQASNKLESICHIKPQIEKASLHASKSSKIVVASMSSMAQSNRLKRFKKDDFDIIIIDEAHHVLSKSYKKIFTHFNKSKVLGVTATPNRHDKKKLGTFFDSLAYEYTIKQAVDDHYLVPLKALTIPLKIDISKVKVTKYGNYEEKQLGNTLEPYLDKIAKNIDKYAKNRKTVIFVPLIKTAHKMVKIMNDNGFKAIEVDGKSKDRKDIIHDFENGKYNVIVNSMLLTEGWDCPSVDCVIVLRPTQSTTLYTQMIGRGVRPYKDKEDLLILDFLWQTYNHDLCRPTVLVGSNNETTKKMQEKLDKETGKEHDLGDLEKRTTSDINNQMIGMFKLMSNKQKQMINPLTLGIMLQSEELMNYEDNFISDKKMPTQSQIDILISNGIDITAVQSRGEAAAIIKEILDRKDKGLCTINQLKTLQGLGFETAHTWSFKTASKMIELLCKHNWKIPNNINPTTFDPSNPYDALGNRII